VQPPAQCNHDGRYEINTFQEMAMRGLEGRVALVTGAGGGIGRAICSRFVEEGINVVAADIDEDSLRSLSRSTGSEARGVYPIRLDVTDFAAVQNAVAAAVSRFGCVDILVNNAGWDMAKPFVETAPDFWDKVIAVNLKGPLNLHRAVLPHMLRTGEGKIINIASDAGRVGSCGEAVYSACKGGLIAFTKTIARECATKNIVVNAVCPGPTDTPLLHSFAGDGEYGKRIFDRLQQAIPLKRLGQPADLPGVIAFLASDDANFITGQTISVSGGLTMHG
jgi:2-hydroxycyclohexanecarboxyl-CoA dehydrogenase